MTIPSSAILGRSNGDRWHAAQLLLVPCQLKVHEVTIVNNYANILAELCTAVSVQLINLADNLLGLCLAAKLMQSLLTIDNLYRDQLWVPRELHAHGIAKVHEIISTSTCTCSASSTDLTISQLTLHVAMFIIGIPS